jgi:hypothetical protein
MKKFGIVCLVIIGFVLIAGCTSCVKNECKKMITPVSVNVNGLIIVDNDGTQYQAKDIYIFNQLTVGKSNVISYIDGNPKLLVSVY